MNKKNNTTNNNELLEKLDSLDKLDKFSIKENDKEINEEIKKIIKNYIRLDNAYKIKHEELKILHSEYKKLYKTCKRNNDNKGEMDFSEKVDNIKKEIRLNDEDMFQKRMLILKNVRDNEILSEKDKKAVIQKIEVVYRDPPIESYKPIQDVLKIEGTVGFSELDSAYINKHNELMQMYKAYQILFAKAMKYKEELSEYRSLNIKSSISRPKLNRMLDEQKFIMRSLDDMQSELIKKDIIRNDERVPTFPVIGSLSNITTFNDTMRDQIKTTIEKDNDVTDNAKYQIEKILKSRNDDERDGRYREMILLRK